MDLKRVMLTGCLKVDYLVLWMVMMRVDLKGRLMGTECMIHILYVLYCFVNRKIKYTQMKVNETYFEDMYHAFGLNLAGIICR